MDFLEKLDFLMKRYGLNKRSLSQKSEIPYTTIDNWYKRGYENLTLPTLRKLASYFNTTLDYWFLDEITDPNYGKSSGFKVEYTEMEHIKKYRSLDPLGQSHVDTLLDWEFEHRDQLQQSQERITELEAQSAAPDNIVPMAKAPVPDHLVPNAAHADDYSHAPDSLKQLEEDIMDDENF